MDISDIAMLEAIQKHGSISKASEFLNITQPTLSKRLARLEDKLGTILFIRSRSGLTPTEHTHYIVGKSEIIQTKIKNIERHIKLVNALEAGELHIGVGPIIEQLYFPHVLLQLSDSSTNRLRISIRTEEASELKKLVMDGTLDIAVGPFDQSICSDEYEVYPMVEHPLMIAARPDHPLVQKISEGQPVTKEEWSKQALIAPHRAEYMKGQEMILGGEEASRIDCDNYSVIKEVLKKSDYISLGPSAVFSAEVQEQTLSLIPHPNSLMWNASCLARNENACLPAIKRVRDTFHQYALPTIESA